MEFFIQNALAADAPAADGGLFNLIMLVVLFLVFYFLLIRPQTKRAKEHKQMVEALQKGDEIITNGGLLGKIVELGDSFIAIDLGSSEVKIQRQAVATVLPKGTMKTL